MVAFDDPAAMGMEWNRNVRMINRLNNQSVTKKFEAYRDVEWDREDYKINPDDPYFLKFFNKSFLATADWAAELSDTEKKRFGLLWICQKMKVGMQFENILQRGLLEYAQNLPNGSPDYRYVHHEVVEESQHSMMFQEFINRAGVDPEGLPKRAIFLSNFVVKSAKVFPALFFLFALAGEEPIDYEQKNLLKAKDDMPPLMRRIMQIHVLEESRHMCFARMYLEKEVPKLSRFRKSLLSLISPIILWAMIKYMNSPPPRALREINISFWKRQGIRKLKRYGDIAKSSVTTTYDLYKSLGLVSSWYGRLWTFFGIRETVHE